MTRLAGIAGMVLVIIIGAVAYSEQPRRVQPSEQGIHAGDSAVASGSPGRHPYKCDDDRLRLVDFKDKGMTIEIRRNGAERPIAMSAPLAEMQYVSDTASARFSGSVLKIDAPGERTVRCHRASPS